MKLSLMDLQLDDFPASVAKSLPSLTSLNLSQNKFTAIPAMLSTMSSLVVLNMNHNQIRLQREDVDTLASVPNLQTLSLFQDEIDYLDWLVWCPQDTDVLLSIARRVPNLTLEIAQS